MKMRHFFAAIAAVFTFGFTVSCDEDYDLKSLEAVQPESLFVTIDLNGNTVSTVFKATESWEIMGVRSWDKTNKVYTYTMPDWLTITPVSGGAGETTVTFAASPSAFGRAAEIAILYGNKTQNDVRFITVQQGKLETEMATCAQVNAGTDGKTYRVKGKVRSIANTQYGNWYLEDATGEVYIYGTLDKKGAEKNFTSLGIEVGDEVTVEGPRSTYGTTVELVNVTVIKITKSLLKVMKISDEVLPAEGGEVTVACQVKGSKGLFVNLTDEQSEWLSVKSVNPGTMPNPKDETLSLDIVNVTFSVAPNTLGPRTTDVVLSSADDSGNNSEVTATISQDGLSGTLELPMTVEEAIAAANAGVTAEVYIKGIVSEVLSGGYGAQYGNASFWISADGEKKDDLTLDFEVYQANWLGAQKWVEGNAQIEVGAEVIVYGPLTVYKGTAETQGKGAAHVYSINGVTTEENGIGTLVAPFNCVGGILAAQAGIASKVYVSGIVSELVKGGFDASYGNGSFWMSDDGVKHEDLSLDFEAYQVNYLGGEKWNAETDPQIAVGDVVVIYGPLTTYKGTSETQGKGAAYIYSINPEMPTE